MKQCVILACYLNGANSNTILCLGIFPKQRKHAESAQLLESILYTQTQACFYQVFY